ncbi:MAG: NAD(P)-binding domain-containing protein [Clostridia bacterium]|nr:NAD(P)-binding domain-containing protein [Clostridia bacterium]
MMNKTVGFIGGGRITRIFLESFKRSGINLNSIVVSDSNPDVLKRLTEEFPEVTAIQNGNRQAIEKDIVFIALHPPVLAGTLEELKMDVPPNSVIVSLAPKLTISRLSELSNGAAKVVRMIPNAPSVIGKGFNPVTYSAGVSEADKKVLDVLFTALGEYRIVPEKNLEAYAVLTAMGPTYLWFQLYELKEIVKDFGLSNEEAEEGIKSMMLGAIATMFEAGLSSEKVIDLIPSKPLADQEEVIKSIYREKLNAIYQKIKP